MLVRGFERFGMGSPNSCLNTRYYTSKRSQRPPACIEHAPCSAGRKPKTVSARPGRGLSPTSLQPSRRGALRVSGACASPAGLAQTHSECTLRVDFAWPAASRSSRWSNTGRGRAARGTGQPAVRDAVVSERDTRHGLKVWAAVPLAGSLDRAGRMSRNVAASLAASSMR